MKVFPLVLSKRFRFVSLGFFALCGVVFIGGCHSAKRQSALAIDATSYDIAFDAACTAAREAGMPPLVKDAVGGVIQGRPRLAGSLIEPWRVDQSSFNDALANTINKQRRRVRVEFVPIDFSPPEPSGQDLLIGAVVPGSTIDEARSVDLLAHQGEIEVRVWVYIEREFIPHLQRSTWTRVGKLYARDRATPSSGRWTPVGRDAMLEEQLLAKIAGSLSPTTQ